VQTAAETFAQKAIAYGMPGHLVDGNDPLALAFVTMEAVARARRGEGPTLIEARTYRRGPHSSSDDPSVYRDPTEPQEWDVNDPIPRFRKYLAKKGHWKDADEAAFRANFDVSYGAALAHAERVPPKPPIETLFDDVFGRRPWHLSEQAAELDAHQKKREKTGGQNRPDGQGGPGRSR
jgi:TPP-dependent pyruvate/acetoin dehydrogenase alpha subunit